MALGWLWGPNRLAISRPWGGLEVALGCLCTPESMPSIWPWGGLGVALGGFPASKAFEPRSSLFAAGSSMFDVQELLHLSVQRIKAPRTSRGFLFSGTKKSGLSAGATVRHPECP